MNEVKLTFNECDSLCDCLETYLFGIIRNDEGIDNMQWLCNLCSVYKKCKEIKENSEVTE